jgi:hypothetical protein
MLIYEVNLEVPLGLASEYSEFLERHVPEMLGVEGFVSAVWHERRPEDEPNRAGHAAAPSGTVLWTIHYEVRSRDALETYFRDQAGTMRAESLRRFGGAVVISRRILEPKRSYVRPS